MTREELIELFVEHANQALASTDPLGTVKQEMQVANAAIEAIPELQPLMAQLLANFDGALHPAQFYNTRVRAYNVEFFQHYELMRQTFSPDVLEGKDVYEEAFPGVWEPTKPPNTVMIGRFWLVDGLHVYDDTTGKLVNYTFDPATATNEIVGTISGSYMSMAELGRKEAVGGVGYAVTREGLRGSGHGYTLNTAFEEAMQQNAEAYGERLRLMLLESENRALNFWVRCGYRWPRSCVYIQPPIWFDPETGEPGLPGAIETLLIKPMGTSNEDGIERGLLLDAIRIMFRRWFGVFDGSESAKQRANAQIEEIFAQIEASLSQEGDVIPLVNPPIG